MNQGDNLVLDVRYRWDYPLYTKEKVAVGVLLEKKHTEFIYYKPEGKTISGVLVRDNWNDNTGGYPILVGGGPNQSYVKVNITSQESRGFDFTFTVYGHWIDYETILKYLNSII